MNLSSPNCPPNSCSLIWALPACTSSNLWASRDSILAVSAWANCSLSAASLSLIPFRSPSRFSNIFRADSRMVLPWLRPSCMAFIKPTRCLLFSNRSESRLPSGRSIFENASLVVSPDSTRFSISLNMSVTGTSSDFDWLSMVSKTISGSRSMSFFCSATSIPSKAPSSEPSSPIALSFRYCALALL